MKKLYQFINWIRKLGRQKPGNWMGDGALTVSDAMNKINNRPVSSTQPLFEYNPEEEYEKFKQPVDNPVLTFHRDLAEGKVEVEEAWLYEACVDIRGRIIKDKKLLEARGLSTPFRIRHVTGETYKNLMAESEKLFKSMPDRLKENERLRLKVLEGIKQLKKEHLLEDTDFAQDQTSSIFDSTQYTEYTPLMGGPFNKQLYLTDYLTMHARAFEEKNHHPLAKRIIDVLAQYSFGRRFKVRWRDPKKEKVWKDFDQTNKITHRCSEYWIKEYLLYGELMIDKSDYQSIDPSTVWDIITNPDDFTDVYYYYQSYPTAYQTFTGYKIPGEPGSDKQPGTKYIVRQLPAHQVIHIKGNVVSQEKRGRSILFPILGWLKRIKDLYDAEVIRAQLQACFIWDDTIKGSADDVAAHIANYAKMPPKATVFAHNEAVERKGMAAMPQGERSGAGIADEILAFIATAIGIPKDFFNVMGVSSGNRATALVGAEPFEKVIEDLQAKFEQMLINIAEEVIEDAGMIFESGDVEFIFPSVTKDTTTETIKNIATGEALGYIDHEAAAEMFAAEMNITNYDFDEIQKRIEEYKKNNPDPLMPPDSRFGNTSISKNGNGNGSVPKDGSPLHGQNKNNLKGQIKTL